MTVSSTSRIVGPFIAGSTFPFTFKVFAKEDLRVVLTSAGTDTDLALDSDYSVLLNPDQDNSPGGSVTLLAGGVTGGALAGQSLVVAGAAAVAQETDITNQSGFFPNVVEDAIDRTVIQLQELRERALSGIAAPISDGQANLILPSKAARSQKLLGFDANGDPVSSDLTIEQIEQGSVSAAQSAADAAATLDLVRGIYDDFDDRYLGVFESDPLVNNDGDPLVTGTLYFNSLSGKLRVYTMSGWTDSAVAAPVSFTPQLFSPNGSSPDFVLSPAPYSDQALFVVLGGVVQRLGLDYTLIGGNTLRMIPTPPAGSNTLLVFTFSPINYGVPNDNSISTPKIQDQAVTTAKLANLAVTTAKLAAGAVTNEKTAFTTQPVLDSSTAPATTEFVHQNNAAARGAFANLVLFPDTDPDLETFTAVRFTADSVVLAEVGGNRSLRAALSGSTVYTLRPVGSGGHLDTGVAAANSWYNVFVIYNPTTQTLSGLFSLSATAPVMPSGFTFRARLGTLRTNASGSFEQTIQYNRKTYYVAFAPVVASGAIGTYSATAPVYSNVSVAAAIPPTARRIGINATNFATGAATNVSIAPNPAYGGVQSAQPPHIHLSSSIAIAQSAWMHTTGNIAVASAGAGARVIAYGWEDNL